MPEIIIIADDLTGANATGVLFSEKGYETGSFLYDSLSSLDNCQNFTVSSISTESRSITKKKAYERVNKITKESIVEKPKLIANRIDSTLRGNIGSEMDGILDALPEDYMAMVVPVFPSSGRITLGGFMVVNSVPLERTGVANDPKTPVNSSFVPDIIKRQSKYPLGVISYRDVLAGKEIIKQAIFDEREKGNKILVFDAVEEEDIELIAEAVAESKIPVISSDPGPFTTALGERLMQNKRSNKRVLMAIGSATELTRKQVDYIQRERDAYFSVIDVKNLLIPDRAVKEIKECSNDIKANFTKHQVLGVTTAESSADIIDIEDLSHELNLLKEDIYSKITLGVAKIIREVLEDLSGIEGLFVTGGDTTLALVKELNASGMKVKEEILPLAVYGKLVGGEYNNLPIVTKGGLIGDSSAINTCIEKII